jgi:hypothetical protein
MAAKTKQIGSPRYQVRLDAESEAHLGIVLAWLRERLPGATESDAIRTALAMAAEKVRKGK